MMDERKLSNFQIDGEKAYTGSSQGNSYLEDRQKRQNTFTKRKAGIFKKANELALLTGSEVMVLVVSETGLVHTFSTPKLENVVKSPEGQKLITESLINATTDQNESQASQAKQSSAQLSDSESGYPLDHEEMRISEENGPSHIENLNFFSDIDNFSKTSAEEIASKLFSSVSPTHETLQFDHGLQNLEGFQANEHPEMFADHSIDFYNSNNVDIPALSMLTSQTSSSSTLNLPPEPASREVKIFPKQGKRIFSPSTGIDYETTGQHSVNSPPSTYKHRRSLNKSFATRSEPQTPRKNKIRDSLQSSPLNFPPRDRPPLIPISRIAVPSTIETEERQYRGNQKIINFYAKIFEPNSGLGTSSEGASSSFPDVDPNLAQNGVPYYSLPDIDHNQFDHLRR
ncbi:DNA-binding transcription factor, MADS-box Map1 [Schizosaccharomyces pombe]|uniref:Pheromone receptor transcription activator n=1 Tax=Schizosaccharomyces pombe (strain 972 / ATCC 24843) TaxID=284812 RepID=PMAP1_SCHPO|nr:MADS-box transcription factor Map1 [Schizosaccharomyces pombe]P78926.1 RecName: Full=Pheromone receptor transcription activator; AltName: Full=Protein map1 [Schizosaccharomyces pombe 972h-]BAA11385.1 map1 [Schizosaccharomyces pombe]CAB11185.1 MADS-box transcription factor Map1 [Schizosaccharomyces pombe]|eukprot:NP_594931.1 MADS-box transcription factor Map1 [Schizosaccharomyces pombe]